MTQGLTQEDVELLGPELVGYVRREAAHRVNELEHRLNDVAANQQNLAGDLNQERVQRALDADPQLGSRWRSINNDPRFIGWLNQRDELSGETRLELVRRAYRLGASDRVAHFFRSYLAEHLPTRERTEHREPFETGRPKTTVNYSNLDRHRIWTRPEITDFYQNVRKGRFDGREAEKQRIEAEILAAGRERRVANVPLKMFGEK